MRSLECCDCGYENGFRTFVLQGGEDLFFTDKLICDIVYAIKERHDDCAVTLSLGEKTKESYKAYFDAGADRYLLRHETADEEHYRKLHPYDMSFEKQEKLPVGSERYRISGWSRLHGWVSLSEHGEYS